MPPHQLMTNRWLPNLTTVLGATVVAVTVGHVVFAVPGPMSRLHVLFDFIVAGGSGIGLIYAGYYQSTHSFTAEEYLHIVRWMLLGSVVLPGVAGTIVYNSSNQVTGDELLHLGAMSVSFGLFVGALIGTFESRALQSAAATARAETRTQVVTEEKDRLAQLHGLLQHYVRNGVTVIQAQVEQLEPVVAEEHQSSLETIDRRTDVLTTLVNYLGRFNQELDDPREEPTDLRTILEVAVASLQLDSPVEVTLPDETFTVKTSERLASDLVLLLEALETVTDADGKIDLACEAAGSEIELRVTAAPTSFPSEREKCALFAPTESECGLKFHLADRFLSTYGEMEVGDAPQDGVQLRIELPGASEESAETSRPMS